MLGRKKKKAQDAVMAQPEPVGDGPPEAAGDGPTTEMPATGPAPAEMATTDAAPEGAAAQEWSEAAPANGEAQAPNGSATGGNGVTPLNQYLKVNELLNEPARKSEDQRQREAAAELEAAFAESRQKLLEEVPGASSPEEAARLLQERQGEREVLPDPEAASLSSNDIYWSDSSVYYRVRKHFTWGPQRGPYRKPWTPPAGLARPAVGGSERRRLSSPE